MRTFTEDRPLTTYGLSIFHGHVEKDRHDNDVSKISFPDRNFNMVHHSKQHHVSQFATIYFGRDKFIKFNSYYSENDCEEHYVELITRMGTIHVAWGDGDTLRVEFEVRGTAPGLELKERIESTLKSIYYGDKGHIYSDDEVSVLMFGMSILGSWGDDAICLNKAEWDIIRPTLRSAKKRKAA